MMRVTLYDQLQQALSACVPVFVFVVAVVVVWVRVCLCVRVCVCAGYVACIV